MSSRADGRAPAGGREAATQPSRSAGTFQHLLTGLPAVPAVPYFLGVSGSAGAIIYLISAAAWFSALGGFLLASRPRHGDAGAAPVGASDGAPDGVPGRTAGS